MIINNHNDIITIEQLIDNLNYSGMTEYKPLLSMPTLLWSRYEKPYDYENIPFIKWYLENKRYAYIDRYIANNYGNREFYGVKNAYNENHNIFLIKGAVPTIIANLYKYTGLWESTQFKYNPIENYDKTSTITTTEKGTLNERSGAEKETGVSNTENGNTRTLDTKEGVSNTNHATDSVSSTTESKNRPWNIDSAARTFEGENVDSLTETDNTESGTTTNTGTITDATKGSQSNSVTKQYEGVTDKKDMTTTVTEDTKGNIGTMTSQQMIAAEREIVDFSFWDTLMQDICSTLCILEY